jgi:hypothetical protein
MKPPPLLGFALFSGTVAGALSQWAMARCGQRDIGSAAAAVNAPSHWIWGEEAIRADDASVRHTGLGTLVHWASSVLWGTVYQAVRAARRRPTAANAIVDAVAVTGAAAFVDLRVVPHRFTPGFERRLSSGSLCIVYGCFAAGLGAAAALALDRSRH